MSAVEQYIKDAYDGGWRFGKDVTNNPEDTLWLLSGDDMSTKALMLLDPASWQAVSKVREWAPSLGFTQPWFSKWLMFISARSDGMSIEEALKSIG